MFLTIICNYLIHEIILSEIFETRFTFAFMNIHIYVKIYSVQRAESRK